MHGGSGGHCSCTYSLEPSSGLRATTKLSEAASACETAWLLSSSREQPFPIHPRRLPPSPLACFTSWSLEIVNGYPATAAPRQAHL